MKSMSAPDPEKDKKLSDKALVSVVGGAIRIDSLPDEQGTFDPTDPKITDGKGRETVNKELDISRKP